MDSVRGQVWYRLSRQAANHSAMNDNEVETQADPGTESFRALILRYGGDDATKTGAVSVDLK
jgi:hypothetical protein